MSPRPEFAIVGAGLSGPLLACRLARAGRSVALYEKRADPRAAGAAGGRSINLALSTRGLHALAQVGLAERVLAGSVPMRGRMIHARDGSLAFQPYGTRPEHQIHSVSRAGLNALLLDAAAAQPGVRLAFERRCVDADLDAPAALLEAPGGAVERAEADSLVGADGAYSAVRAALARRERYDYRQDYLEHGYKELTMPPRAGGGWAMEKNALHIWPRGRFMMIALPNADGSFTCTLFWPFAGPDSFAELRTPGQVRAFFDRVFPDAPALMPELPEDFLENPVGSMVTVRCRPWRHAGKAVLIGDAAHAVVPFYGQGMNASFEDCSALAECLERDGDRARAFARYEERRKEHADALAELAVGNFLEMRDRTASRAFRLRKGGERLLARLLPGLYLPLYEMISFSRIPYADAVRRARRQDRLLAAAGALLLAAILAMIGAWN